MAHVNVRLPIVAPIPRVSDQCLSVRNKGVRFCETRVRIPRAMKRRCNFRDDSRQESGMFASRDFDALR
jgi:hypothetical protein